MGRTFLKFYVAICIFVISISMIVTVISGTSHQVLDSDDWLIFIIACCGLAISEALEEAK